MFMAISLKTVMYIRIAIIRQFNHRLQSFIINKTRSRHQHWLLDRDSDFMGYHHNHRQKFSHHKTPSSRDWISWLWDTKETNHKLTNPWIVINPMYHHSVFKKTNKNCNKLFNHLKSINLQILHNNRNSRNFHNFTRCQASRWCSLQTNPTVPIPQPRWRVAPSTSALEPSGEVMVHVPKVGKIIIIRIYDDVCWFCKATGFRYQLYLLGWYSYY